MSAYKKNNKFLSYLIILISLFILVLFTKDSVMELFENTDSKETYSATLVEKKATLQQLNNKKNELANSSADLDKFTLDIKEDEIIDYIYSHIEDTNGKKGIIVVKSISLSEATDTELGFKETIINLNLRVPNEERLKTTLEFLTSSKSKYNFYITSFTYPYGETDRNFNVSIPMKVLHK